MGNGRSGKFSQLSGGVRSGNRDSFLLEGSIASLKLLRS